jgi:hypothetical protein
VSLLPPEALNLGDRQAADADLGERFAYLVELERLDDGFDLLHECSGNGAGLLRRRLHQRCWRRYCAQAELIG